MHTHTPVRTQAHTHAQTQRRTHTFDGVDDVVQVFGVVAVWPAARAYLQGVVGPVLCEKLNTRNSTSVQTLEPYLYPAHLHSGHEPTHTHSPCSRMQTLKKEALGLSRKQPVQCNDHMTGCTQYKL